MRRYFLYLFLVLSNIIYTIQGENLTYDYFNHLGIEDGLSQLSVLDIFRIRTDISGWGQETESINITDTNSKYTETK